MVTLNFNILHISQVLLLLVILTLCETAVAQIHILEEKEWYRQDYAEAGVDTVKLKLVNQNISPENLKVIKTYNRKGCVTYYEKVEFHTVEDNFVTTRREAYSVRNNFFYDKNNRLIKIDITSSLKIQDYPIFHAAFLKRNKGAFQNDYGEYFLDNFYSYLVIDLNSINFSYNAAGVPTKQWIDFTVFGIALEYVSGNNSVNYSSYNLTLKKRKSKTDTLTITSYDLGKLLKMRCSPTYLEQDVCENIFSNYKDHDLTNKWYWTQSPETFLRLDETNQSLKKTPLNQNEQFRHFKVIDNTGKVVFTKESLNPQDIIFNCVDITKISNITSFQYTNEGLLKNKNSYFIYRFSKDVLNIIPFCENKSDVFQVIPGKYIIIKQFEVEYNYNQHRLLEKKQITNYNFDKVFPCSLSCIPLNLNEESEFYSYVLHQ